MADFTLDGRVALVTGASRGLGRHFAGALAKAGATVALAGRDQAQLAEVQREIGGAGGRAMAVPLDVTDGKSVTACVAAVEQALGPIDILVNNAGIAISGGGRIGNTDFLQIARKMGAVDALQKPFDPDDLLGRINICLKAA